MILRRLHGALAAAAERGPADFADLLLVARRRRAHRALARDGGGGGAWRALPLRRSRALLARPWRQGPPSLSGADQGLRQDDRGAEGGASPKRKLGNDERLEAIRRLDRAGAPARTRSERADACPNSSRRSSTARMNMAGAACLAGSRLPRRPPPKREQRRPGKRGAPLLASRFRGRTCARARHAARRADIAPATTRSVRVRLAACSGQ